MAEKLEKITIEPDVEGGSENLLRELRIRKIRTDTSIEDDDTKTPQLKIRKITGDISIEDIESGDGMKLGKKKTKKKKIKVKEMKTEHFYFRI